MNEVTVITFAVAVAFGAGCLFLCGGGLYLEVLSLRDKWKNFVAQENHEKGGNEMKRNNESGQSMTEYVLILFIVAVVVIVIMQAILNGAGKNVWENIQTLWNRPLKDMTFSDLLVLMFFAQLYLINPILSAIRELKPKPPVK